MRSSKLNTKKLKCKKNLQNQNNSSKKKEKKLKKIFERVKPPSIYFCY